MCPKPFRLGYLGPDIGLGLLGRFWGPLSVQVDRVYNRHIRIPGLKAHILGAHDCNIRLLGAQTLQVRILIHQTAMTSLNPNP